MANIRIKPLSENLTIGKDELNKAATDPLSESDLVRRTHSPDSKGISHLVGMPAFHATPFTEGDTVITPVGQIKLTKGVLTNINSKKSVVKQLKAEYQAMIEALIAIGVDFRIFNLERGDKEIIRWLDEKRCGSIKFPRKQISRWLLYPRDMFVYIKALDTLLVHSELFKLRKDRMVSCEIIHSQWAEGGRVLLAEDRMIVGTHPEDKTRSQERKVLDRLREKGMNIAEIPCGLFYRIKSKGGGKLSLFYDNHIDRSACLLRGKKGDYHVVLGSGYRTGKLIDPLSYEASANLVRKACERIEAQVHVSKGKSVLFSISVVQFSNGKLLVTKGDEEILDIFEDIVGSENLFVTDIPISAYPVFAAAGLHCLITENPEPLVGF